MKILAVAIPNHHFFQWINQIEDSEHEVVWFDIQDDRVASHRISWVKQVKRWKMKWDYPFRTTVKSRLPQLYKTIQAYNDNNIELAFDKTLKQFRPEVIHVFEMHLSGIPIFNVLNRIKTPIIYSSWGSDLFNYQELGRSKNEVTSFLKRVDFLLTDCKRDERIARKLGFEKKYLGTFPGNGGIQIDSSHILPFTKRDHIIIKGYNDGIGQALLVLKALELLDYELLESFSYLIYSADQEVITYWKNSKVLSQLPIKMYSRQEQLSNATLLKFMGKAVLHIANSTSDGMPNSLLEAMGMGAFPIQSNPGKVTQEVITHGKNGYLIEDPMDYQSIKALLENAILDKDLRCDAQEFNLKFIDLNYNRHKLRPAIQKLYLDLLA